MVWYSDYRALNTPQSDSKLHQGYLKCQVSNILDELLLRGILKKKKKSFSLCFIDLLSIALVFGSRKLEPWEICLWNVLITHRITGSDATSVRLTSLTSPFLSLSLSLISFFFLSLVLPLLHWFLSRPMNVFPELIHDYTINCILLFPFSRARSKAITRATSKVHKNKEADRHEVYMVHLDDTFPS